MTELEQARAHLKWAQDFLSRRRGVHAHGAALEEAMRTVLAALSWVWDAQERAQTPKYRKLSEIEDELAIPAVLGDMFPDYSIAEFDRRFA